VREFIIGPDEPIHKDALLTRDFSVVCQRMDIGSSRTKWWGADRHIVIYYTTRLAKSFTL